MKNGIVSFLIIIAILFSFSVLTFAENVNETQKEITVSLRIDGYNGQIFNDNVKIFYSTEELSLKDALSFVAAHNEKLDIKGLENENVTEINGEFSGFFGRKDGWFFAVNDERFEDPLSNISISDGDKIVFYYADFPCQYAIVDTSDAKNGILYFYSNEIDHNENSEAIGVHREPITSATVIFNGAEFVTDGEGKADLGRKLEYGDYTLSLKKTSETENGEVSLISPLTDYPFSVVEKTEPFRPTAMALITVFVLVSLAVGGIFLFVNLKKVNGK